MQIIRRQHLWGANRWFGERTLAVFVEGVPQEAIPPRMVQTLAAALERLPLPPHLAGADERLRQAVPPGEGWERGLIELAAEWQYVCSEMNGGRAAKRRSDDMVEAALECSEFALAEACLEAAARTWNHLQHGEALELEKIYEELAARADEVCLGGATGPIVAAARRRGIPAYRLDAESLVQLGEGIHQQHVCTAMTGRTSQIAVQVSTDKHLVHQQWGRLGIPIAASRLVHHEEEAVRAAEEIGWPVVVKPADADYGRGVALHLRSAEQVRAAYSQARRYSASGRVLVQRYLRGASHRLLVVAGRLAAAVRRDPLAVVGDGRHNVRELVEEANQQGRWGPHGQLALGECERACLDEAGFRPETVPPAGVKAPVRQDLLEMYRNVTEQVHPETRELAADAARVIGLDVAGLDAIAEDIGRPLAEQGGGFLEINAQPALAIHRAPHCDQPQAVGDAIIASLFPPPADGRVPLILALGGQRANEVIRLAAEHLRRRGLHVAASTPDETRWMHRPLAPASAALVDRLAALMLHPRTEVALASAPLAEVWHAGLGTDRCSVLVLADGLDEASEEGAELSRLLGRAARRCVVDRDAAHTAEGAIAALGLESML